MVFPNIKLPGQRWVWRLHDSEVQDCIFDVTHDVSVARMKEAAAASAIGLGVPDNFSLAIDTINVEKVLEVSALHKSIIGGAFPNHVFSICNLPKDYVKKVIVGTSVSVKINKSTEVKSAVMSFQLTSAGVLTSVVVDAQPQGTNNMSNFVKNLNAAVIEAGYNKSSYTNFCVE